jgi:hypothetical protein
MGVVKVLCDKCRKDILPGFVELLNEAHGTELTMAEIPALASRACFDPDCELPAGERALLEDLGVFMLTRLAPQRHLCDDCSPEGSEPTRPGRLH